jgi:helix-turn-helix protein
MREYSMAAPIIAALRHRDDLKESVLHTAQELAHRASIYGVVRVSYTYLAQKCHCSRRTVMRHIQRLIDARILRKTVLWIRGNYCEVNTYAFVIAWDKRPHKGGSDTTSSMLPPQEREKNCGVREELDNQKKGIRFLTPGTALWQKVAEEITRLEQLVRPGG